MCDHAGAGPTDPEEEGDLNQWTPPRDERRANPALPDTHERLLPRSQIRRQPELDGVEGSESSIGLSWADQQDMCQRARVIDTSSAAGQNDFDPYAEQLVESFGIDFFACFEDEHRVTAAPTFRGRARTVMGVRCHLFGSPCHLGHLMIWQVLHWQLDLQTSNLCYMSTRHFSLLMSMSLWRSMCQSEVFLWDLYFKFTRKAAMLQEL